MPRRVTIPSAPPQPDLGKGLFRTILAGPGQSLNEAFASLERAKVVQNVNHHRARNLFGARVHLTPDEGEGYWDLTRIRDDAFVIVGRFAYKDPRVERLAGDDMIQFCFNLASDLTIVFPRSRSLRLKQPSMLIYHHPPDVELTEWTEPSAREHIVAVNVRPAALVSLLGDDVSRVPEAMRPMVEGHAAGDFPVVQMSMTAEAFEIASKLLDNPYEGPLALVYTEAIATELLCTAVGAVAKVAGQPSEQYTEREIRCLQTARAMLMRQLSKPPTIPQVARAAGINETTLKRGFKAMFGETIFDFSVRCRMQHALTLFRERGLSVAEVADAVGYRHQTSFATAFRRHFGMRPKDVRRTRST